MAQARFDENFRNTIIGVSAVDFVTPTNIAVNPTTRALQVEGSFSPSVATTATLTNVAASTSSVTLLASNANRRGVTIFNDSSADLYVKCGATASTSSFTYKLSPFDHLEIPFGYTGRLDGIWASATGNARITEFT